MCGITGRVGDGDVVATLLSSLENLEYRGYDSAGLAVNNEHGLELCKQVGEISRLKEDIGDGLTAGSVGVGHTRWSTHGEPTQANAHPHVDCTGTLAVVHNGIIENYADLRAELRDRGHEFTSETDTEVIPHLVEEFREAANSVADAFRRALSRLEGRYAVVLVVEGEDAIYASRRGSPLVIGVGDDGYFLASDVPAFLDYTDRVVHLEDGDVAVLTPDAYRIVDREGGPVQRPVETVDWAPEDAQKSGFDHYMLKEIHEQPAALSQTVHERIAADRTDVDLDDLPAGVFEGVEEVQFVACGTSYHAAMYGRQFLARRGVTAATHRAGEYATDPAPVDGDTLVVAVSQSGETADVLESVDRAKEGGARTLALTNVVGSTAARECDDAFYIRAGPEIGVAATKTFSSQVAALSLVGERVARDVTGTASTDLAARLDALEALPDAVQQVLDGTDARDVARRYRHADAYFFIGRGLAHPVALEGALKFKEITYEHAEGFAAGQLKHGPLALVTENTPVVAVFSGNHVSKTLNNVEEVQARGAPVVAVVDEDREAVREVADETLLYPGTHPEVDVVPANVQLQLLAYHAAALRGRPIDKPRNLAKSVTVE